MSTRLREMKQLAAAGVGNAEIGRRFGISRERVRQILGNRGKDHLVAKIAAGATRGRLTALEAHETFSGTIACSCACGADRLLVLSRYFLQSAKPSCGCLNRGEHGRAAKLTDEEVRAMRSFCAERGYGSVRQASRRWGITVSSVSRLIHGGSRADAGGPILARGHGALRDCGYAQEEL